MANDFIRYYISNISIITLQRILHEINLDDWELLDALRFNLKSSYGYEEPVPVELIEALRKRCTVVAEHRDPENVKRSLIWNGATVLIDILTLLSLARAEHIDVFLFERRLGGQYKLSIRGSLPQTSSSHDIVPLGNLSKFISEALIFIEQNPEWLKESGFIHAVYWYIQAQKVTAPTILEMAFYWVCLEILASTYLRNRGINNIRGKEQKVRQFIKDRGYTGTMWRFLSKIIKDWYEVRGSAFHKGKDPEIPTNVLSIRKQQVRDITSLVLVEMLQGQGEERRQQIADRMKQY